MTDAQENRRQVLYWRLLSRLFDHEEQSTLESASLAVLQDIGLPPALLDQQTGVDSIVQRHPELAAEFDGVMVPRTGDDRDKAAEVRRAALVSKVLLNIYGTGSGNVTAGQLSRWQADAGWLERALGCRPGQLRGGRQAGQTGTGVGSGTPDLSNLIPQIGPELAGLEADLVKRMHLREVLADPALAAQPRCRRQGVGSALLAWLEATAGVAGITTLRLETRSANAGARAFYRHHGFEEADRRPGYYQGVEDAVRFVKRLGERPA